MTSQILSNISSQKSITSSLMYPHVKTHKVYEIAQDLLSIAVCWKRLRNEKDSGAHPHLYINNLLDQELFKLVTVEDIARAASIRDYYSKKIMLITLTTDMPLTSFKKDLSHFISSDGKIFKEEMLPLVYRLPEFYEYDLAMGDIIQQSKSISPQLQKNQFLFLNKLYTTIRKIKRVEFWFLNHESVPCRLRLDATNILIPVLENTIKSSPGSVFTSTGRLDKRLGENYWYLDFRTLA